MHSKHFLEDSNTSFHIYGQTYDRTNLSMSERTMQMSGRKQFMKLAPELLYGVAATESKIFGPPNL